MLLLPYVETRGVDALPQGNKKRRNGDSKRVRQNSPRDVDEEKRLGNRKLKRSATGESSPRVVPSSVVGVICNGPSRTGVRGTTRTEMSRRRDGVSAQAGSG